MPSEVVTTQPSSEPTGHKHELMLRRSTFPAWQNPSSSWLHRAGMLVFTIKSMLDFADLFRRRKWPLVQRRLHNHLLNKRVWCPVLKRTCVTTRTTTSTYCSEQSHWCKHANLEPRFTLDDRVQVPAEIETWFQFDV